MDQNALEEKFFIPSTEPFEELKDDLSVLAHRGTNGIFYFYMDHGIYGIDLKSLEYVALASGLTKDQFAVSADHSRAAWQENTGIWDSQTIQIMDLDTGDKAQLGGQAGSVSRIFGFVGNDCIYGTGDSGDYLMSNGRVMGVYLKSIDIVDRETKSVMHYEKPGSWIREVSVNDSRIHMKTVTSKDGFFGTYSADTLVCNAEILPGKADDIGWYASDQKGQVLFVQGYRDGKEDPPGIPEACGEQRDCKADRDSSLQGNRVLRLRTGQIPRTVCGVLGRGGDGVQQYGIRDSGT